MMSCRATRTMSERRSGLVKREAECVVSVLVVEDWDARRLSRTMTPGREGLRSHVLRYSDSLTTTEMQVWREHGWLRRAVQGRAEFTDLVEFRAGLRLDRGSETRCEDAVTQAVCLLEGWHATTTMTMVIMARKEPRALLRQDVAPTRGACALEAAACFLFACTL